MSVKKLRRKTPNTREVIKNMTKAYFHSESAEMSRWFMENKVTFDTKATVYWISKHHRAKRVLDELLEFQQLGTLTTAINDINIHLKLESLLKPKVIKSFLEQQPRSIMWQNYFVSAIFSPIFMELKRRLKLLLHANVIYADGATPEDLGDMLKDTEPAKYFFENDLEKQDRQTDRPLIEVELTLYKLIGCHEDVLALWQTVHEVWRFKSNFSWGFSKEMRLSGQATTALGNWITDMQVHAKFICDNIDKICYILMLGDDNNMGLREKVNVSNLKTHIATHYNMMCDPRIDSTTARFCCFLTANNNGNKLVPDIKRARHRFEVTNGVSEASEENMKLRALSYKMMNSMKSFSHNNKEFTPWFDATTALEATASLYKTSVLEIENDYALLYESMNDPKIFEYTWDAWHASRK